MTENADLNQDSTITPAKNLISDDELWEIVGWHPTSQQQRGKSLFGRHADSVWSTFPRDVDNRPSVNWTDWAKNEIRGAEPLLWKYSDSMGAAIYLCRLMRLLELFNTDASGNVYVDFVTLKTAFASGLALVEFPLIDNCGESFFESARSLLSARGMVIEEERDDWQPGMKSGSGWRKYCRLSVAGKRYAASLDKTPMPKIFSLVAKQVSQTAAPNVSAIPPSKPTPWFERSPMPKLVKSASSCNDASVSTETHEHYQPKCAATPTRERKLGQQEVWIWQGSEAKLQDVATHLAPLVGKKVRTVKEWSVKYRWTKGVARPDDRAKCVGKDAVFHTLTELGLM